MKAIFSFKRDVESSDEYRLAWLELASLARCEPIEVSFAEAIEILEADRLPFMATERRTVAVEVTAETLQSLVRRLAFWDLALLRAAPHLRPIEIACGSAWADVGGILAFATQSQVLEWTAYAKDDPALNAALREGKPLDLLIECANAYVSYKSDFELSPLTRRKNDYLTHGFHKYKAKFFPRLARSLINYTCPNSSSIVLDPYCGSGTTGVEATIMGVDSVQFDLDPLSVFISESKGIVSHIDMADFEESVGMLPRKIEGCALHINAARKFELPRFLLERNPKKLTSDVLKSIESEGTHIRVIVDGAKCQSTKLLFGLAFSHALATKVSLRWMGTGDNRYALEIGKRTLYSIFLSQLHYMTRKLRTWDALQRGQFLAAYGQISVAVSDCTSLPLGDNSVDAVVTSPPYLPAASGRETYLRSRAASLVGLSLLTEDEIHECEKQIVGSILAIPSNKHALPASVTDIVSWMLPQRERTAKANPTTAYFEKLGSSLKEMKRVVKPGGIIALVVSKEHMFYEMTTRKILRKFDMVAAIVELATEAQYGIGLALDQVQELELPKMDFAARPGSHGTYSEAIIFFRNLPTSATDAAGEGLENVDRSPADSGRMSKEKTPS